MPTRILITNTVLACLKVSEEDTVYLTAYQLLMHEGEVCCQFVPELIETSIATAVDN